MASVIITSQPASLTAVPGQNSTFSVTASANFAGATYNYLWSNGATTQSITIDPLIGDNGNTYSVAVSALSAVPPALSSTVVVATVNSSSATLTVQEDARPFDVYDKGTETGRQRHLRLRLLGYI